MINKITEIIEAWATSFKPTLEQKAIAEQRLETCQRCEFWGENMFGIYLCKKCGCATKAKVFSKTKDACPLKKWTI